MKYLQRKIDDSDYIVLISRKRSGFSSMLGPHSLSLYSQNNPLGVVIWSLTVQVCQPIENAFSNRHNFSSFHISPLILALS